MPGYRRAYKTAKRVYPLVLAAYRRWDTLSEEEKERYREQARRYSRQAASYSKQAATYARDAASRAPLPKRGGGGRKRR
ncbi:MAG TPA: hypothetical protein VGI67_14020 [Thermoleophilaceae bacterium]|jgi:hypothetical protein